MIANIHDEMDPHPRSGGAGFSLTTPTPFDGFDATTPGAEAAFARLTRDVSPGRLWVREGGELRGPLDDDARVIPAGTLCQIGRHLAPGLYASGGVFCQIVSGPHRGLRFASDPHDFRDERGGLSGSRKPVRSARAA